MTKTENVKVNGKPALHITCDCATHKDGARSAILTGATGTALAAKKGKAQSDRIHGFVTMAHHPAKMIRVSNERSGIFAA
jgi:hypothetical protein